MNNLVSQANAIQSMSQEAFDKVYAIEAITKTLDQEVIETSHVLHGGIYSRTIKLKSGVVITGAVIKVPTMLTIQGDVSFFANDKEIRVTGYAVIPASKHRKQAFIAHADTWLTMSFKSGAISVTEAENEFTDDADLLISRHASSINHTNITGE
tara:strand:+ start:1045 stop:1506 length:462 start_codon:yes stop_codon:yes gene_type:complete